jgi:hypothetical protein
VLVIYWDGYVYETKPMNSVSISDYIKYADKLQRLYPKSKIDLVAYSAECRPDGKRNSIRLSLNCDGTF